MQTKSNGGVTDCPGNLGDLRPDLGFKAGSGGAHSSRTMMLADLTALLSSAPAEAKRDDFNKRIVEETWTHAGFFKGKIVKTRTRPVVTPAVAAYALSLGYLCGLRGQVLLESFWARLLDIPREQVIGLTQEAAKRGWLDFKGASNIFEINFHQLLTPKEIQTSHGPN